MKYLIIAILCSVTLIARADTFVAGVSDWMPYTHQESKSGLSIDIIRAAFDSQGHSIELKKMNWTRTLHELKANRIDIVPAMWMSKERKKFAFYSDHYAVNRVKFIKRKDDNFKYTDLESLHNKKVGVVRDFFYHQEFLSDPNIIKSPSFSFLSIVKKLLAKRIDLAVGDEVVVRYTLNQAGNMLDSLEFCEPPLSEHKLYMTSGLGNPRHREIIEIFNKGLKEIKANGTYDAIFERYVSN